MKEEAEELMQEIERKNRNFWIWLIVIVALIAGISYCVIEFKKGSWSW